MTGIRQFIVLILAGIASVLLTVGIYLLGEHIRYQHCGDALLSVCPELLDAMRRGVNEESKEAVWHRCKQELGRDWSKVSDSCPSGRSIPYSVVDAIIRRRITERR